MKNLSLYRTIRDQMHLTPSRMGLGLCVAVTVWAMFFSATQCEETYSPASSGVRIAHNGTNSQAVLIESCKSHSIEPLWLH